MVALPGFSLLRNDRNVHGGGVALFIHDSFSARIIAKSDSNGRPGSIEHLMCELSRPGSPSLFAAVIYRPPHVPFTVPVDLGVVLAAAAEGFSHKVIMGDFNADQLGNSYDAQFVRSLLRDNALKLVDHGFTHCSGASETWLDLCVVDESDDVLSWGKSPVPLAAGHHLIFASMTITSIRPEPTMISSRRLTRLTTARARGVFAATNWDAMAEETDSIDGALELFYERFFAALDRIAPVSLVKVNSVTLAPWLSPELRTEQRHVRRLYRRFRRNRRDREPTEYRRARVAHRLRLSETRIQYYRTRLEGLSQAEMWRELRSLGLLKERPLNKLAVDPEALNKTLASFCTTGDEGSLIPDDVPVFAPVNRPLLELSRVSTDEVRKTFNNLRSNAQGADGLSLRMIMPILPALLNFFVDLFNRRITTCSFPRSWEEAVIVPIPKISIPSSAGDYRPISLLSTLSKAFEHLIHSRIMDYVNRHSLLDLTQCGFRGGHSTSTALLRLLNDVWHAMDRRQITVLVLFDFSKAFDSVSHPLLLRKLRRIGFSRNAEEWVRAYLCDRRQAIKLEDGSLTAWIRTNTGVPQGSVLGPLLFSLFINDIGSAILFAKRLLYADDLQIYASCSPEDISKCIEHLNADITRISDWASRNRLTLNLLKTKAILLGNKRFINQINVNELPPLTDGIHRVPLVSSVKNLGVILDSKLTFQNHVSHVTSKVHGTLYRLQQLKAYTDTELRKSLVSALVRPHLDYCSSVLSGAGVVNDLKLQRLANRGLRYVYNLPRDAAMTRYRHLMGWLTTKESRDFSFACLAYNVLRGSAPQILAELFFVQDTSARTRGSLQRSLVVPKHRTEAYRHSCAVAAALIWNAIPRAIAEEPSFVVFKTRLRHWFLTRGAT